MSKNTLFPIKSSLRFQGKLLFVDRPLVMGILNVTPDSFYAGSRVGFSARGVGHAPSKDVVEQARQMVAEGADILDIGGCSTRCFRARRIGTGHTRHTFSKASVPRAIDFC
jgi:dihydropteroate synthase